MATNLTFSQWLEKANLDERKLTAKKKDVLRAAFEVLQDQEDQYAAQRIAEHILLRSDCGFKQTHIAALIGWSSRTVARHQSLSTQQMLDQIQQRRRGNPHGKLLPRHLGPIVQFLYLNPKASRQDLLEFIQQTWGFRVSRVALWKFLHKFGVDPQTFDPLESCQSSCGASHQSSEESSAEACSAKENGPSAKNASPFSPPSDPSCSTSFRSASLGTIGTIVESSLISPWVDPTRFPGRPQYLGHTQFAGAFVLWPEVMQWLEAAEN